MVIKLKSALERVFSRRKKNRNPAAGLTRPTSTIWSIDPRDIAVFEELRENGFTSLAFTKRPGNWQKGSRLMMGWVFIKPGGAVFAWEWWKVEEYSGTVNGMGASDYHDIGQVAERYSTYGISLTELQDLADFTRGLDPEKMKNFRQVMADILGDDGIDTNPAA